MTNLETKANEAQEEIQTVQIGSAFFEVHFQKGNIILSEIQKTLYAI